MSSKSAQRWATLREALLRSTIHVAGAAATLPLGCRSAHQIQNAAMISNEKAIGPWGMVWLICSSQPNATRISNGSHETLPVRPRATAVKSAAAKAAQEPVRLTKDPTPPTQESV